MEEYSINIAYMFPLFAIYIFLMLDLKNVFAPIKKIKHYILKTIITIIYIICVISGFVLFICGFIYLAIVFLTHPEFEISALKPLLKSIIITIIFVALYKIIYFYAEKHQNNKKNNTVNMFLDYISLEEKEKCKMHSQESLELTQRNKASDKCDINLYEFDEYTIRDEPDKAKELFRIYLKDSADKKLINKFEKTFNSYSKDCIYFSFIHISSKKDSRKSISIRCSEILFLGKEYMIDCSFNSKKMREFFKQLV